MSELKPCPFCGEMPIMRNELTGNGTEYHLECFNNSCPVVVQTITYSDPRPAMTAWNERKGNERQD